ncbi:THAP domain-containing protein 7 [Bienertia sinuspersici]
MEELENIEKSGIYATPSSEIISLVVYLRVRTLGLNVLINRYTVHPGAQCTPCTHGVPFTSLPRRDKPRRGMWTAVKKIDPGLRAYQAKKASGAPLSRYASLAHINTRVSADYLKALNDSNGDLPIVEDHDIDKHTKEKSGVTIPRVVVIGGAIALACTIDKGLLTKAVIFGVVRRFARMGRKLLMALALGVEMFAPYLYNA